MTEVVSAVKAVQENRIDATMAAVGMGAIAEADTLVGVRFLPNSMDPERIKAGQRCTVGAVPVKMPAGLPGLPEPTPLWGLFISVLASTRMTDDTAYKLVETWWGHYKEYGAIHPLLKRWTPNLYVNKHITAPYHSGAVRFYKDKGEWSPEMEKIQNLVLKGD